GNRRVNLVARKLTALAGLGALRDLDLHHIRVDEIFRRHAEAARGDLLDRGALWIARAIRQRQVAIRLFAALARVRLAADTVHRNGKRRMRLAADRAERHSAGREALDDIGYRLDFLERYRSASLLLGKLDVKQAAYLLGAGVLAVDLRREFLERLPRPLAHRVL